MAGDVRQEDVADWARRIAMVDTDGRLEESCREIWALVEGEKRAIARAYWERYARSDEIVRPTPPDKLEELTDRIIPHIEAKHGALSDPRWVDMTRGYVDAATKANISLTTLYSGITACGQAVQDALNHALPAAADSEKLARLSRAVIALTALEIDVFSAHYDVLRTRAERERRSAPGAEFNKEIVGVVDQTASGSRKVRAQAADASAAARGVL